MLGRERLGTVVVGRGQECSGVGGNARVVWESWGRGGSAGAGRGAGVLGWGGSAGVRAGVLWLRWA